jgi:MurE/MurF fusion protein
MEKRQPMGEIAGAKADVVIITSDNPRSESGAEIALQVNAGVRASDSHKVLCTELDRRAAIGMAFSHCSARRCCCDCREGSREHSNHWNRYFSV